MSESPDALLERLFAAERDVRGLHDRLAAAGRERVMGSIRKTLSSADKLEQEEASLRLVCVARLLGEFEGADVADALVDVLACDLPEVRSEAGEQLEGLAFERFREVAEAAERALLRLPADSPALVELPYLLVEIPEGGVLKLLGKFLAHGSGDVVASAIEALVEIGDLGGVKMLLPLQADERTTVVGDDRGAPGEVTIGELAIEALELLQPLDDLASDED